VHHAPAGPPLSARMRGAVRRSALLARGALRHRSGRLALGAMVSTVVGGLVLTVPVVSGAGGSPQSGTTLESSASTAASSSGDSPVVMGRDGRPVSSSTSSGVASSSSAAGTSSEETVEAAPGTTGSASAGSTAAGGSPLPSSSGSSAPTTGTTTSRTTTSRTTAGSPASQSSQSSAPVGTPAQEAPAEETTSAGSPASAEDQAIALVNEARAAAGCAALVADGGLAATAAAHSTDMRKDGALGLLTADGGSVLDLGARAASVANGPTDADSVVDRWLAGADAVAILDCSMSSVGVGIDRGTSGPWWTLLLA